MKMSRKASLHREVKDLSTADLNARLNHLTTRRDRANQRKERAQADLNSANREIRDVEEELDTVAAVIEKR